jgi:hypothetical protein
VLGSQQAKNKEKKGKHQWHSRRNIPQNDLPEKKKTKKGKKGAKNK